MKKILLFLILILGCSDDANVDYEIIDRECTCPSQPPDYKLTMEHEGGKFVHLIEWRWHGYRTPPKSVCKVTVQDESFYTLHVPHKDDGLYCVDQIMGPTLYVDPQGIKVELVPCEIVHKDVYEHHKRIEDDYITHKQAKCPRHRSLENEYK